MWSYYRTLTSYSNPVIPVQTTMAAEDVELSRMDKENDSAFREARLHSEEIPAIKRPRTNIKKAISWGNRSDLTRSISQQRKKINCFFISTF